MIYESFSLYKNGHLAPLTQRPTAKSLRPLSNWSFLSEISVTLADDQSYRHFECHIPKNQKIFHKRKFGPFFYFIFLIKYLNLVRTIMKTSINTRQRPKQLKLNMPKRLIKYQVSGYTKKKAKERV